MEVKLSKADYRLILNARIYGGIFWATMSLGVAWMLSWAVAPRFSDFLQLAMSIPPLAYFAIYFTGLVRRKPIAAPKDI
jgi:hypothetical protein